MQSKPPQLSSRLALIVLGLYPMAALAQTAATPALVFTGIQTSIPVSGLASVSGVARDPSGNLFVLMRQVSRLSKYLQIGDPQKVIARGLATPSAIAADSAGNLYVASTSPAQITKIALSSGGASSTVSVSNLVAPAGLAIDGSGNLYVADSGGPSVIKLTPGGTQTAVGNGWAAPVAVAIGTAGDLSSLRASWRW